jgi:hypothetical protein
VSLVGGESLVYWLKKLVFRSAWLDHRVKEGILDVAWDEELADFAVSATRTATARCSSSPPCLLARAAVPALIRAGLIAGYLAALLAVDTQVDLRTASSCSAR